MFFHLLVLQGKNSSVGRYAQAFQSNSFMPALFIVSVFSYNFVVFLVTLASAEGHNVSGKKK